MRSSSSIKELPEVGAVHCLSLEAFKSLLVPFEGVYLCKLTRDLLGGSDPSRPRQRLYAVHLTARSVLGPIRFFTARAAVVAVLGQRAELVSPSSLRVRGSWKGVVSRAEQLQGELAGCLGQWLSRSCLQVQVVIDARHWLPDEIAWATPLGTVESLALREGHWQLDWSEQASRGEEQ
ncbi:hypothetical protein [Thermogemmatispora sp.]|uniref:hypothetical protein n=1 Tax=Thermogemmatispora sp. TaxID=1968838 RepID=UPI0035E43271